MSTKLWRKMFRIDWVEWITSSGPQTPVSLFNCLRFVACTLLLSYVFSVPLKSTVLSLKMHCPEESLLTQAQFRHLLFPPQCLNSVFKHLFYIRNLLYYAKHSSALRKAFYCLFVTVLLWFFSISLLQSLIYHCLLLSMVTYICAK